MNKLEKSILFTAVAFISLVLANLISITSISDTTANIVFYVVIFVIGTYGSIVVAVFNFLSYVQDEINKAANKK